MRETYSWWLLFSPFALSTYEKLYYKKISSDNTAGEELASTLFMSFEGMRC
jgi:hypothetical protein